MMDDVFSAAACDHRARCFVNGTTRDKENKIAPRTGHWHQRFASHPWVQLSEHEGWGRELRAVVIDRLKRQMMRERQSFQFPTELEYLMPDGEWVTYTRDRARQYREGFEWQKQNAERLSGTHPRDFSKHLANVMSPAFRGMQRNSPNRGLHMSEKGLSDLRNGITDISRRMTGERDE